MVGSAVDWYARCGASRLVHNLVQGPSDQTPLGHTLTYVPVANDKVSALLCPVVCQDMLYVVRWALLSGEAERTFARWRAGLAAVFRCAVLVAGTVRSALRRFRVRRTQAPCRPLGPFLCRCVAEPL